MSNPKPLILVTGPNKRFPIGWWSIRFMLWLVGLRGIYRYPGGPEFNGDYDGVIISGGDDIHPDRYGDEENPKSRYDPARDALEIQVLCEALEKDVPILGICRGSQLLNIVADGTLHQDIRPERKLTPNKYTALPVKEVEIKGESQLAECVEPEQLTVNSLHNQAVKKLGKDMLVTARDADGFIQAIEHKQKFIVGVQWHPEYLPYLSSQRAIFHCFARAVESKFNGKS